MTKIKTWLSSIPTFWSKLLKNVMIVLTGQGASSILNMFVVLAISAIFGPETYGILVIGQTYMQMIDAIFNFQSWHGIIKYGNDAKIQNKKDHFLSIIKSGFIIDLTSAALGTVFAVIFLTFFSTILN